MSHVQLHLSSRAAYIDLIQEQRKAKAQAKTAAKQKAKAKAKSMSLQLVINPNNLCQTENNFLSWHYSDLDNLRKEAMIVNGKTLRGHLRAGFETYCLANKPKADMAWVMGLHKVFSEYEVGGEAPAGPVHVAAPSAT